MRCRFTSWLNVAGICLGLVLWFLSTAYTVADVPPRSNHDLLSLPHNKVPEESREVCAFCHFPQGGEAQSRGWVQNGNRSSDRFKTFATTGISFPSNEPKGTIGSVSMACLSCHDGVNAQNISTVHRGQFSHPVGVPYAGGIYLRDLGTLDVELPAEEKNAKIREYPKPGLDVINQVPVWWVETGTLGRQKSDLQLYSRIDVGSGVETPYVECSTCHDPHGKQDMFLRKSNQGSILCRACHRL